MQITIRVRRDAARGARGRRRKTQAYKELLNTADDLGVVLEPIHPQVSDSRLEAYYSAEVPDRATAEKVIAELRQLPAVEAAYVKPPDGLP